MNRLGRICLVAVLLGSTSAASALAGFSTSQERVTGARSAARERDLDPNDVLDDESMTNVNGSTVAELQAFLERTPYGGRSVLADYRPKGKSAAQIIVDTAREYRLNPVVLVVRAQLEQGLVSKATATSRDLERAFGCGCPDVVPGEAPRADAGAPAQTAGTCSAQYSGFENQARCAGSTLRRALDRLAGPERATKSGWAKGKRKETLDEIAITPKNDATAALYSYTPWVGKLGGGRATVGGTSAHWELWHDFEQALRTPSPEGRSEPAQEAGVAGCRVIDGRDSCPAGSRCDQSDGLVGRCAASSCDCSPGLFCDPSSKRCVECTARDTINCRAERDGDACIAGACGCRTSADCGYDRARVCDPIRGVCIEDPVPRTSPEDDGPSGTPPKSGAPDAASADESNDSSGSSDGYPFPPTDPAPLPDLPPPPSADGDGWTGGDAPRLKDEKLEVPKSDSGGCAMTPARSDQGQVTALLGLAVAAVFYRRRTRA
jgi:hypothetical protein